MNDKLLKRLILKEIQQILSEDPNDDSRVHWRANWQNPQASLPDERPFTGLSSVGPDDCIRQAVNVAKLTLGIRNNKRPKEFCRIMCIAADPARASVMSTSRDEMEQSNLSAARRAFADVDQALQKIKVLNNQKCPRTKTPQDQMALLQKMGCRCGKRTNQIGGGEYEYHTIIAPYDAIYYQEEEKKFQQKQIELDQKK